MAAIGADQKYCFECGEVIRGRAEICPKCGVRQPMLPSMSGAASGTLIAPNGKSKLAAALLAIFLGGLGVHKFYLGQVVWGILYLVFCWTFIPAVIGFIEGLVYISMSDQSFIEKYGTS